MAEYEELLARLRKLEDENQRLSARIDELTTEEPVNRRGMFKRAAMGAAALAVGAEVVTAPEAAAADGANMIIGQNNGATSSTGLIAQVNGPAALTVTNYNYSTDWDHGAIEGSSTGYGVRGIGDRDAGVIGQAPLNLTTLTVRAGVAGAGAHGLTGVYGISDTGEAILGHTDKGTAGVHGNCQNDNGIGVFGDGSYAATGVYGHSGSGDGVRGVANEGNAVHGIAVQPNGVGVLGVSVERSGLPTPAAAILGDSKNQNGVEGFSQTARGGVFAGGQAAIRLMPGTLNGPPADGRDGDLYVDSAARLWYYRGSWYNIA